MFVFSSLKAESDSISPFNIKASSLLDIYTFCILNEKTFQKIQNVVFNE